MPGLDGLRAIAVLAVIAFHLNTPWASGGLLGVGMFFTLSGYLITDLLLASYVRCGRLPLRDFWARRARRLLPALLVMLAVVTAWITVAHRAALPGLRGAVLSAVGFVGNWWLIVQNVSYFDRFAPPTPLGHLWSLAVEEQFYLVWPWVLLGALWLVRRRRPHPQIYPGLAVVALGLTAASAVWMALLYQPGFDNTRAYDGTDTRAFGFLVGAALALVWPSQRLTGPLAAGKRWALDTAGAAGLAVIVALIVGTDEYSPALYRGGLVALSVATAVVVAVAAHPASRVGRALGSGPLRWVGVRSYGIYLWHLPVIVLTGAAIDTGRVDLPRAGLQLAATIGLAALSWKYVEQPIRHGAWPALAPPPAAGGRPRLGLDRSDRGDRCVGDGLRRVGRRPQPELAGRAGQHLDRHHDHGAEDVSNHLHALAPSLRQRQPAERGTRHNLVHHRDAHGRLHFGRAGRPQLPAQPGRPHRCPVPARRRHDRAHRDHRRHLHPRNRRARGSEHLPDGIGTS